MSLYQFTNSLFVGVITTLLVVVFTSLKVVISTRLFVDTQRWHPVIFLSVAAPKASAFLLIPSLFEMYINGYLEVAASFSFKMCVYMALSGLLAFFLNFSNFMVYQTLASPTTYAIITNCRKVALIFISVVIFSRKIYSLNAIGILVTFAGFLFFTSCFFIFAFMF